MELYISLGIGFIDLILLIIATVLIVDYIKLSNGCKRLISELKELEQEIKFKLKLRSNKTKER